MKSTFLNYGILLALACNLAGIQTTRAAHAATYLDAFGADISGRLENPDPDLTTQQQRALTSASRTLNRQSTTLGSDLGLLSRAADSLTAGFPEDTTFATLENDALNNYLVDAQSQYNAVLDRIGSNNVPPNVANQLTSAQQALDNANDSSNTIGARARSAAFALKRIQAADKQAARTFRAPASLDGSSVALVGRGGFGVTLNSDGTYVIPGDTEETGTWTFERTGARTGIITASPSDGGTHTLNLSFSNATRGRFTGTTAGGEAVNGAFTVSSD